MIKSITMTVVCGRAAGLHDCVCANLKLEILSLFQIFLFFIFKPEWTHR